MDIHIDENDYFKAATELQKIIDRQKENRTQEEDHVEADAILTNLLLSSTESGAGCHIVELYDAIDKWYA